MIEMLEQLSSRETGQIEHSKMKDLKGKLNDIELGCIATVLGYERSGWNKEPSVKQARRIKTAFDIHERYKQESSE